MHRITVRSHMPDEQMNDAEGTMPSVEVEKDVRNEQTKRDRATEKRKNEADVKADEAIYDRFEATDN
jgi:hypothetical protein